MVERCHVIGNEDPDAVIPESRVLLAGHESQNCTHGPHHEPAKDAVWQRAADQEDVDPEKEAQDEEAEPDGRVKQQREEQEAVTWEPVRIKEPLRPRCRGRLHSSCFRGVRPSPPQGF